MEIKITSADLDAINDLAKTNEGIAQALSQLLMLYALAKPPTVTSDTKDTLRAAELDRIKAQMIREYNSSFKKAFK